MGDQEHRPLVLEALTPQAWAPFGALPTDEGAAYDTAECEFLWGDGHVNFIAHRRDEVSAAPGGGLVCELLNRHDTHTQTLMPMDDDAVVVVAPAELDFSHPSHLDAVRAFEVPRLVPVHLSIGTWHWGPYPLTAASIRVFNVQGRGYVRDNGIAWLERDLGVAFAVGTR